MASHDPLREEFEIRNQLASAERRLAFFLGAGTSMAVGLPGIAQLTKEVGVVLEEPYKTQFTTVMAELHQNSPDVENVLDHLRLCRELFDDSEEAHYGCLTGATATKELDYQICRAISGIVGVLLLHEPEPHIIFSQWLRQLRTQRDWPVEVFTTNYDLVLEQALEKCTVPFFDGFVGSVAAFFAPEFVEAEPTKQSGASYLPRSWTRLWKLHGSVNWCVAENAPDGMAKIRRVSIPEAQAMKDLVIFPSRDKYAQSRKLPFLSFQDRLRRFLSNGSCLMFVLGYSFSDEHLNEIIFEGLGSNPELAITVFVHSAIPAELTRYAERYRNLTFYGPDSACVGGIVAPWTKPSRDQKQGESWPFWDNPSNQFILGDFNDFASFLDICIGLKEVSSPPIGSGDLSDKLNEIPKGDIRR